MTDKPMLAVNKRQANSIKDALNFWVDNKIQTAEQIKKCKKSVHQLTFDWKRLAIISAAIATIFIFLTIMGSLANLALSKNQLFVVLGLCSAGTFCGGYYLDNSDQLYSRISGFLYFLGFLFLKSAAFMVSDDPEKWALFVSIIGGLIGLATNSGLTWGISLGIFGLWFCIPSNIDTQFVNPFELRALILKTALLYGVITFVVSIIIQKATQLHCAYRGSLIISYLFMFLSLLALSSHPQGIPLTVEIVLWSIGLTILSLLAITCGIRNQLPITTKFGVVFLLLNIIFQFVDFSVSYALDPTLIAFVSAILFLVISKIALCIADCHMHWQRKAPKDLTS